MWLCVGRRSSLPAYGPYSVLCTYRQHRNMISTQWLLSWLCCKVDYSTAVEWEGGCNYLVPVGWTSIFTQCGSVQQIAVFHTEPRTYTVKHILQEKPNKVLTLDNIRVETHPLIHSHYYRRHAHACSQTSSPYKIFTLLPWEQCSNYSLGSWSILGWSPEKQRNTLLQNSLF